MDYREARVYLADAAKYGSVLGLENMGELLRRLGNPQDDLKFIHISGTNGKGSVLAYLSTVLKEAGYRVGRYISPTLFSYRERIQVNEEYIEKEPLARLTGRIAEAAAGMVQEGRAHPTVFEIETALGFLYFREKACDIVVLETGLGGLEDATNVVKTTLLEVITPISMDHIGILGDTLREIAEKKAGIIKPDTVVVTAEQEPEAMEVIRHRVKEKECRLFMEEKARLSDIRYGYEKQYFSYGGYENLEISLGGMYQVENAALAVEAVKALDSVGYPVTEGQLRQGLQKTRWRGRFTVVGREPVFIIDGAHNRDAARILRKSLELYFTNKRLFYIMGVFRDKEYEEIVRTTVPLSAHVITVETPGNDRALPAGELLKAVRKYQPSSEAAESILEAVKKSLEMAGREDVILAFGSLSFLGETARAVEIIKSAGNMQDAALEGKVRK